MSEHPSFTVHYTSEAGDLLGAGGRHFVAELNAREIPVRDGLGASSLKLDRESGTTYLRCQMRGYTLMTDKLDVMFKQIAGALCSSPAIQQAVNAMLACGMLEAQTQQAFFSRPEFKALVNEERPNV